MPNHCASLQHQTQQLLGIELIIMPSRLKKKQKSALDWIMNNIFHVDIVRSDFKLMRLLLSKQATYDMLFGICFQNSVLACVVQFMNYNLENVPKCVNMNENTSIISMNSHSSLSKCQKINN